MQLINYERVSLITIKRTEFKNFKLPRKKPPDSDHFTEKGCKTLTPILHNVIEETEEGGISINSFY